MSDSSVAMNRITVSALLLFLLPFCHCSTEPVEVSLNLRIEQLNSEFALLASRYGIDTLDTYTLFLDSKGKAIESCFKDPVHLDTSGYNRWIDSCLVPFMDSHDVRSVGMLGNSITQFLDNGPAGYGFGLNTGHSWSEELGRSAWNFGVSENKAADLLARLATTIQPQIEWYFIEIGTNDAGKGVPIDSTVASVEMIIRELLSNQKKVVLQMVMPRLE
jgi:lysophospholipase L1-like esterase